MGCVVCLSDFAVEVFCIKPFLISRFTWVYRGIPFQNPPKFLSFFSFFPPRCTTSRGTCRMEARWWSPLYLRTSATASSSPWSSTSWTLWTPSCRGRRARVHMTASLSPSNCPLVSHCLHIAHLSWTITKRDLLNSEWFPPFFVTVFTVWLLLTKRFFSQGCPMRRALSSLYRASWCSRNWRERSLS